MIKINRLRLEILSDNSESISDIYGFDIAFESGLNIIAGSNSRGKTTINSCIYYALGMEELLGAYKEKALDKALKDEFEILNEEDGELVPHKVMTSKVLLEIENNDTICTLKRDIKTNKTEKTSQIISIYEGGIDHENYSIFDYFVNGEGNNDLDNGFYGWLAKFIGIEIPYVSNTSKTKNHSPLYLQIIFSSLFIEQTKGWSDFLATMPFFGIPNAKQKTIEFLLNLNALKLSTKKDILDKEKKEIEQRWLGTIRSLELASKQYNSEIINLPKEVITDKKEIRKISILFSISEEESLEINDYINKLTNDLEEIRKLPLTSIKENQNKILAEYTSEKQEYIKLKQYTSDFHKNIEVEKIQLGSLKKQQEKVEKEIIDQRNLNKIFSENIINKEGNHCPTCTQEVSVDLISSNNIEIPKLSIDETISFLKSQKELITTSIKSLNKIVTEKQQLYRYFQENLREKENILKSLSRDLIADDRSFSEAHLLRKLQLEKKINDLNIINQSIVDIQNELIVYATKYHNNRISLNSLHDSDSIDENQIKEFETEYKKLLYEFGYESNPRRTIWINRKLPFKYFPVYKRNDYDKTPQSIRINSSASDFVRNIWAYTIAMLSNGNNHIGLIMFDEPGQHRTNLMSLKSLFKKSSEFIDKQILIFTSINKKINDAEKLEINILTEDIQNKYTLIELNDDHKVIHRLQ